MRASELEIFQTTYEQRFGCCICLGPKLNMISGHCQHRICDDCIYEDGKRRACMEKCPVCGKQDSFPTERPIVPMQVIEVQRCIGVQECPNGCQAQMWYWEVEEHNRDCSKCTDGEAKKLTSPCRRRSRVGDRGKVSVISRLRSGKISGTKASRCVITRSQIRSLRPRLQQP